LWSEDSGGPRRHPFQRLTFGLRTRVTILPEENCRLYSELWDELHPDWQPRNRTELCYLETMVTSQWLLTRLAGSEQQIYERISNIEVQLKMLAAYVDKRRAQLERPFRTAIADMKQSKKERQDRRPQPPQTAQAAKPAAAAVRKPAGPQPPAPDYVMSEGAEASPVSCAPATPDSR